MAQTVIVKLTDDLDGGDADETVEFSLDGKSYQIDLNKKNAAGLRKALEPYVQKGRVAKSASRTRSGSGTGTATLFSGLDAEEKDRFRRWAKMPTARRIGDGRVQEWIDAGRP
ncbi:MAG: Lsr2 family protein [Acidimicrobiales bacterium]|jgi:hypothetical protein